MLMYLTWLSRLGFEPGGSERRKWLTVRHLAHLRTEGLKRRPVAVQGLMYARYMKYLFTLTLVLSGMTWAADPVPMDVKTGEWETTVTMQMGGLQAAGKMPAIPPEQLSKMPPEQRARIESAMKALGGAPTTTTSKNC